MVSVGGGPDQVVTHRELGLLGDQVSFWRALQDSCGRTTGNERRTSSHAHRKPFPTGPSAFESFRRSFRRKEGPARNDVDPREAYGDVDQSKPPIPTVSSDAGEGPGEDPHPVEQEQIVMGPGPPGARPIIRQNRSSNFLLRSLTLLTVLTRGGVEPGLT